MGTPPSIVASERTTAIRPGAVIASAFAGAVSGVAAKAADQSQVDWLNDLGTYPAVWILIIVAVSRWSSTPVRAAGYSVAFFVSMVASYYLYARQVLGFGMAQDELIWSIAAVTVAPLAASFLNRAAQADHPGWSIVPAVMAGIVLASGPLNQYVAHLQQLLPPGTRLHPVQVLFDLIVAAAIVIVIPKTTTHRLLAALFTVPATWLAPHLIQLATNLAY